MKSDNLRSALRFAACVSAVLFVSNTVHSQTVEEVLQRLKPMSLTESSLRQLAGKDHFEPYMLNPVLTPGTATRTAVEAGGDQSKAGPWKSKTSMSTSNVWDGGALGSASVIKVDGVYHLYYEAWGELSEKGAKEEYDTLQIGHAVSLDGAHWAKDPANPIVRKGAQGEWDHDGTWDPFVIHEDGQFKMWYGGNAGKGGGIGYAVSPDGSRFDKRGRFSQLAEVEDIHVVHDHARREYLIYYWDRDRAPWNEVMKGPPAPSGLFVARSKNETGFDFDHAKRISVADQPWPAKYSHVLHYKDRWVMFFGEAVTRGKPSGTGIAFSANGFDWQQSAFPLLAGHDAEVIEAAPGLWLMYYGPNGYFDWPECDLRLAIYDGPLEHLSVKPK